MSIAGINDSSVAQEQKNQQCSRTVGPLVYGSPATGRLAHWPSAGSIFGANVVRRAGALSPIGFRKPVGRMPRVVSLRRTDATLCKQVAAKI